MPLTMKRFLIAATVLVSFGASDPVLPCSIHPKTGIADAAFRALAKVTQADAQSRALNAVNVRSAIVSSGELEAVGGCLIYSFDIQVPGQKSIIEVAIDAGTGQIRSKKHENPKLSG